MIMDKFLDGEGARRVFRYLINFINKKFSSGVTFLSFGLNEINATVKGSSIYLSFRDIVGRGSSRASSYKVKTDTPGGVICFKYSENEVFSVYSGNSKSSSSNKALTTLDFDPFDSIFYYDSPGYTSAGSSISGLREHGIFDIRYQFNINNTLIANRDIFIKCAPLLNGNGRVRLANSPITQQLPTTEDGFVYILLGNVYYSYNVQLIDDHPIYYYKDGAIRVWTNAPTVDISGKEDKSNKVTSLSSSSTDTQYPSAKLVYNTTSVLAPKASPALTGTPTAPTAAAGTNTTQIATTAFVKNAVDSKTHYVANLQAGTAANYITEPEFKSVKINGSSTNSASSSNCVLQYDTTNKCLKFIFN